MITLQRNKQKMKYALYGYETPRYDYDENQTPIDTGETEKNYYEPVDFSASINNKLDEVLVREFGIDDTTKFSQIVAAKGYLPLKTGSVIWKQSEVKTKTNTRGDIVVDEKSADYTVMGVADEGLNFDLFLLQKNV